MDIATGEFIEQTRQGMNLMRDACAYIPWEQCPSCPFHSVCYEQLDTVPVNWEEE